MGRSEVVLGGAGLAEWMDEGWGGGGGLLPLPASYAKNMQNSKQNMLDMTFDIFQHI